MMHGNPPELRAQVVGHELDDEHHATYGREYLQEKLHDPGASTPGRAVLDFNLNLPVLRALLSEAAPR